MEDKTAGLHSSIPVGTSRTGVPYRDSKRYKYSRGWRTNTSGDRKYIWSMSVWEGVESKLGKAIDRSEGQF